MELILTFGSSHRALKAEEALKKAAVRFRLLPAPKPLAAYCDLVILVAGEELAGAEAALERAGVEIKYAYRKEGDGYVKV